MSLPPTPSTIRPARAWPCCPASTSPYVLLEQSRIAHSARLRAARVIQMCLGIHADLSLHNDGHVNDVLLPFQVGCPEPAGLWHSRAHGGVQKTTCLRKQSINVAQRLDSQSSASLVVSCSFDGTGTSAIK